MKKWLQAKGFTSSPKALAFRLTVRTYIRIVAKDFVGDNAQKTKKPQRNLRAKSTAAADYKARRALSTLQLGFVFVCIACAVSMGLHFSVDKFPDPDVFYHFRHAELYGSITEIFRTDFPWVHYSVISKLSSDLWYGFHVLIIPFTLVGDRILGMQLA